MPSRIRGSGRLAALLPPGVSLGCCLMQFRCEWPSCPKPSCTTLRQDFVCVAGRAVLYLCHERSRRPLMPESARRREGRQRATRGGAADGYRRVRGRSGPLRSALAASRGPATPYGRPQPSLWSNTHAARSCMWGVRCPCGGRGVGAGGGAGRTRRRTQSRAMRSHAKRLICAETGAAVTRAAARGRRWPPRPAFPRRPAPLCAGAPGGG